MLALVMGSALESLMATGEAEVDGDTAKAAAVLEAHSRSGIVTRAFAALSGS